MSAMQPVHARCPLVDRHRRPRGKTRQKCRYFHRNAALEIAAGRPVFMDKFLEDATDVDTDCITDIGRFADPLQKYH